MRTKTWRTIIVETPESITVKDNCLAIGKNEDLKLLPLEQIQQLVISSGRGSISLPAIEQLTTQGTGIVFCNNKCTPICETLGIGSHFEKAGRLMDQSEWKTRRKQTVWKQIVKGKILQQIALLERCNITVPARLYEYLHSVESDDATNREALASRIYFGSLFGADFLRFDDDSINAALNYGYTVLRAAFDRAIVAHGYRTELGIHHCSRQNPYNLSCDLMEPFRPFVDEIIFANLGRELDWEYKQELIALTYGTCEIGGLQMIISDAIDEYTANVLDCMLVPRSIITEVGFAEEQRSNTGYV